MARGAVFGPRKVRQTTRQRTRGLLSQGKVRKKQGDVMVDIDVGPMLLVAADGIAAAAAEMLADAKANAPDDPSTPGSRIAESGGFLVYVYGQVIEVEGGAGKGFRKPRDFRPQKDGVDSVVSFSSRVHHLQEMGTVKMRARPYLGPARMRIADRVPAIIASHWPKGAP
jgi:hypothetical protein